MNFIGKPYFSLRESIFYFYCYLQIVLLCIYRNLTCFSTVCLLLRRKATTNLDVLKSRDTTLPIRVHLVKAMGFPSSHVQTWELNHKEAWVPKNWCFQTVALEKMIESPLDCKGSNQSTLKKISPEYSLEGLILKLNI